MARTTSSAVQLILLKDYDGEDLPSLSPYIEAATAIVDRVESCASEKEIPLSATELELIERWLSAHFYQMSDQAYTSKSTGGASGSFKGQFGAGFEITTYGQMALRLDYSGCLSAIDKRQTAGAFWLGKEPSNQTPYYQRD